MIVFSASKKPVRNFNIIDQVGNGLVYKVDLLKKKEQAKIQASLPWWARLFISIGSQFVSSAIVGLLAFFTGGIAAPLAFLIEFGINAGIDLAIDIATGQTDGLTIAFDVLLNFIPTFTKYKGGIFSGLNSKVARIGNSIDDLHDSTIFKQLSEQLDTFGKNGVNKISRNYYQTDALIDSLKFEGLGSKVLSSSRKATYSKISNGIRVYNKTLGLVSKVSAIVTSPNYAIKKATQFIFKKPIAFINKKINGQIDKIVDFFKSGTKLTRKTAEKLKNRFYFNSRWIDYIQFMPSSYGVGFVNAVVRFKPEATNNKKPVVLFNKNINDIAQFISSPRPGHHYLENFCWGWKISRILDFNKQLATLSFIPLFSNLITPTITTFNTIRRIQKQIEEKQKIGWLDQNMIREALTGAGQAVLNGISFKGLGWIKAGAKTILNKDPRYLANYGARKITSYAKKKIKTANIAKLRRKSNGFNNGLS
ncbi:hypothetical protein [[Mycoplasma] testudinis]|uniref:hypothetical protein n=1 Tax=[Mycoplasma] testudinis TaxID=33924 RepID=UPI000487FC10|nr:hypothetical protein [[Mycoplasma] testudinis]